MHRYSREDMMRQHGPVLAGPHGPIYASRAGPILAGPPAPVPMGPPPPVPTGPLDSVLYDRRPYYPPGPIYDAVPVERARKKSRERTKQSSHRQQKPSRNKIKHSEYDNPLQQWSAWRTAVVNGGITEDVVHNTYKEIAVGEEYNRLARPSRRNQSGVYQYSTAIDQATRLHKEDFINFGIPRAQISTKNGGRHQSPSPSSLSSDSDVPIYSINKLNDRYKLERITDQSNKIFNKKGRRREY
ncbi:hypothetical protein EB796_001990 [Bugula neritina]|uniref:Uncharacterized protein n=1 Tax=Bugula neritina TaxID=10212 RepID=A0A7J7KNE8_BUGNE|nr:hypothetical protein EB796_001990 [Bugula neritina]